MVCGQYTNLFPFVAVLYQLVSRDAGPTKVFMCTSTCIDPPILEDLAENYVNFITLIGLLFWSSSGVPDCEVGKSVPIHPLKMWVQVSTGKHRNLSKAHSPVNGRGNM